MMKSLNLNVIRCIGSGCLIAGLVLIGPLQKPKPAFFLMGLANTMHLPWAVKNGLADVTTITSIGIVTNTIGFFL